MIYWGKGRVEGERLPIHTHTGNGIDVTFTIPCCMAKILSIHTLVIDSSLY